MFDPGSLVDVEGGSSLYSGPDLDAALEHEAAGAERELWLREQLTGPKLKVASFRGAVNNLLNEELTVAGDLHLLGPVSVLTKVSSGNVAACICFKLTDFTRAVPLQRIAPTKT